MTAKNQNTPTQPPKKMTALGILKWTLYWLVLVGIIAVTFVVAALTE